MDIKLRIRFLCHRLIQCLNAVLIISSQVMVAVSVVLCLLCISKQLYLVQNQAAWSKAVGIGFGVSVLNVTLTIFMLILSRVAKYSFPKIKQHKKKVGLYLRTECNVGVALMLLTALAFKIYTGGADFATWQGDPWWAVAAQATWWISFFALFTNTLQLLTWGLDLRASKK